MRELPQKGKTWPILEEELKNLKSGDYNWRRGRLPHYIWSVDDELFDVQMRAYSIYHAENALGAKRAFPSLDRMERDIIEMALSFLGGESRSDGSFTSGGTESIFLAVKSARDYARATRGAMERPNIVLSETAHPAFNKAAHFLGLTARRLPTTEDFRSDVQAMAAAIDSETIMLVGSAPQYPNGVFDRIEELGALAQERSLWLHVDACVGGFLAPFARKLGHPIPPFDLSVPGVTSLSADLHKYGCCMKGASLVLYKDGRMKEHQRFSLDWVRGTYATETFPGTRPGGPIAAAWAVMHYLGMEGYVEKARAILDTVGKYVNGIAAIDGLEIIKPYDLSIIAYASKKPDLDINAVADLMGERGWFVGRSQKPKDCIQMALNPVHGLVVDEYLNDLKECVAVVSQKGLKGAFNKSSY